MQGCIRGAGVSTVLSHKVRRAAHARHLCGFCGKSIAIGSDYLDLRAVADRTAYTWKAHLECDVLWSRACRHFAVDDEDGVHPTDLVHDYQREMGLSVSGWPTEHCRSDEDGDCNWERCPQNLDNEPVRSGRHCPLDSIDPEV